MTGIDPIQSNPCFVEASKKCPNRGLIKKTFLVLFMGEAIVLLSESNNFTCNYTGKTFTEFSLGLK